MAIVGWVDAVRYRFPVPFVLPIQLVDWFMRGVIGELEPLVVDSTRPNRPHIILVPFVAVALSLAGTGHRTRAISH